VRSALASIALSGSVAAASLLAAPTARALDDGTSVDGDCADGRSVEHAFDSGAAWSLCARVDDVHGLELRDVRYRAPGDSARTVLRSLHVAQLLVHWHDTPSPERRLGGSTPATRGLGGAATLALDPASCAGTRLALTDELDAPSTLCTRERASGLLAKYARRPALHAERWELFAIARQGLLTWRIGAALTEDGQIVPSVALSGRAERTGDDARFGTAIGGDDAALYLTRATLLATWRLRFALDTPATDRVEELDFALAGAGDNRRPMQVRGFDTEVFRPVAPVRFRGWRVVDPSSGSAYTLDPLDSARRWNAPGGDWARFALALTRARDCERHAEANATVGRERPAPEACGDGLDEFVDGESLDGADPVLWFSNTRLWTPRREDLPFLSSTVLEMRITPFDWTASSPFESAE